MTDRRLQQAIDACRPGSPDVQSPDLDFLAVAVRTDPELRRRYERSQQFDAAVSRRFHDVPVPDDLAERVLAAVDASAPAPSAAESGPRLRPRGGWMRGIRPRTRTVVAGGMAAAAAIVVLLVTPRFLGREPVLSDRLPAEVLAWGDAVTKQGWNGNLLAAELRERPLDRAVRVMPRRWCQIATDYDAGTIVYDLTTPGGAAAFVFCMRSKVRNSTLGDTPWNSSSATGGLTLGVWRRGDMVYVLMVQGGQRRYREFIEASPLIGLRNRIGHPALLVGKA